MGVTCLDDGQFSTRQFWIRRFSRLYPAYLIAALLMLAFAAAREQAQDTPAITLHLLMLQSWLPQDALAVNGPGWSLSVEAFFYAILPLVIKTIANIPEAYLDVDKTKGATQWQLVTRVLFPIARADLWDHLRGVYGVGWGWIIMAEVVIADRGLGFLISISERRGHIDSMFAVIAVIIVIAVICDQIWKYVGMLLFPYRNR